MISTFKFLVLLFLSFFSLLSEAKQVLGPKIAWEGFDLTDGTWRTSVLYGFSDDEVKTDPTLVYVENGVSTYKACEHLSSKSHVNYIKCEMRILVEPAQKKIEYFLDDDEPSDYYVPGYNTVTILNYSSCNGCQYVKDFVATGGIDTMWGPLCDCHEKAPVHVQLQGGDIGYQDGINNDDQPMRPNLIYKDVTVCGILAGPEVTKHLKARLKISGDKKLREFDRQPLSEELRREIRYNNRDYWLRQYNLKQYHRATKSIPTSDMDDDHDTIDGCGSYDPAFQEGEFFKYLRKTGSFYVNLLQQHREKKEFPATHHYLKYVNNRKVAILGIDMRSERTRERILPDASWQEVFRLGEEAGMNNMRHLLVMVGVPVVYAAQEQAKIVSDAVESIPLVGWAVRNSTGYKNEFGYSELADDLYDGWGLHKDERTNLIERLQMLADKYGMRVTILSGDVHFACVGKIYPKGRINSMNRKVIFNVTSSAIGNVSPGAAVSGLVSYNASSEQKLANNFRSKLLDLHDLGYKEKSILIAKRNYMSIKLIEDDYLQFTFSVEQTLGKGDLETFSFTIPPVLD